MLNFIDVFLDRITMYRLVLYYLLMILSVATIGGAFGLVAVSPLGVVVSAIFLVAVCYITNSIFSYVFEAPTNVESVYITALILACIISPFRGLADLPILGFAGVLAISSKYILAIGKKHIFNPVAISVLLVSYGLGVSATWWVGTLFMLPFLMLGGLLVLRKTQRFSMVISFYATSLVLISILTVLRGSSILSTYQQLFFHTSFFFFAYVMLTEPLTTPPKRSSQILYGGLVGLLFPPQVHFLTIYSTPELALVIGNFFSYLISPKTKLVMTIKEKLQIAPDIMDYLFAPKKKLAYLPGQYLEWTLAHPKTDSRGNRRYFTLASSPTEDTLRIGVKFYEGGSSFKRALHDLNDRQLVVGSQLAGDFLLPTDKAQKLVFIAGGIGITPFRSMLKYLIDTKEQRDIVVMFSNKVAADVVYQDVLEEAQSVLGIKTVYTVTDKEHVDTSWIGKVGRIDAALIQAEIPDWKQRHFYLSGPHPMVAGFDKTLRDMGVPVTQIKKDFFPGFA